MKPHVYCICATAGRHQLLERSVACFIAQNYEGNHTLLIYNNSEVEQELGTLPILPPNKRIELVNNHIDRDTHKPYDNLGAIYRDALDEVSSDCQIIVHWDDDDIFLPNHISEGVKGLEKAQRITDSRIEHGYDYVEYVAYKPSYSWFRHAQGVDLMNNNLEPSIFIDRMHLLKYGYKMTTTDQHYGWFQPLIEQGLIFVDPEGVPTLIYNWGDINIPTFKTSGNAGDPNNFNNYRAFSQDHGSKEITPMPQAELQAYYAQIYQKLEENAK